MKIKIDNKVTNTYGDIVIEEAFNGLTIRTREGKELNICLRDFGFDMNINNGEWFHIDKEEDICCLKCNRKKKLDKINKNETQH